MRRWKTVSTSLGQYVVPLVRRSVLKQAAGPGESEQSFEQAFAALAYACVKDKSPRLMDFVVGFQLIDRDEEDTKAFGVFGFKVGDAWFMVPCFFLNGEIKGHDMLYVKSHDVVVPLNDKWVNYLLARRPYLLGRREPKDRSALGTAVPSLLRLRYPLYDLKSASSRPPLQPWVMPFLPVLGRWFHGDGLDKSAADLRCLDLRRVLGREDLLAGAFQLYRSYPLLKQGFDRFYGGSYFLERQARQLRRRLKKADVLILRKSRDDEDENEGIDLETWKPRQGRPRVRVIIQQRTILMRSVPEPDGPLTDEELDGCCCSTPDDLVKDSDLEDGLGGQTPILEERERNDLARYGLVVRDQRSEDEVSRVYSVQVPLQLHNPVEPGVYDVLVKPGQFRRCAVLLGEPGGLAVVVPSDAPSGETWTVARPCLVWTRQCDCPLPEDWIRFYDQLKPWETLPDSRDWLCLVGPGGRTFGPFTCLGQAGPNSWYVEPGRAEDVAIAGPSTSPPRPCLIVERNPRGTDLVYLEDGRRILVPGSFRLLRLARQAEHNRAGVRPPTKPLLDLGTPVLLQLGVLAKDAQEKLQLRYDGAQYVARSRLGQKAASWPYMMAHLIEEHGLRQKQAEQVLREARDAGRNGRWASYYVKYAAPYPFLQPTTFTPPIPEPEVSNEQFVETSARVVPPLETAQLVSEPSQQLHDPLYAPDHQVLQVAQQAAQAGRKELFDVAVLSSLLKRFGKVRDLDRDLGDLMKAMDRIGKLRILFYWHQEEFEDRYGKSDLPELENLLASTFEMLGDLVLYMKEKTIRSRTSLDLVGVGTPDAEPSIDAAADL